TEIAATGTRTPATVRSQLLRGLELLRRRLPKGLAAPALVALGGTRGLDAVRASVLRKAGVPAATVAPALGLVLGAMTMKKPLLAVSCAALLGTALWLFPW